MARAIATSIDDFIASYPPATRERLEELRALIRAAVPDATETISYGMPTFDLRGRHLVHFAGHRRHVGFYPTPSAIEAFEAELAPYKRARGSVQFPLDRPMPWALIRRMVKFRLAEVTADLSTDRKDGSSAR